MLAIDAKFLSRRPAVESAGIGCLLGDCPTTPRQRLWKCLKVNNSIEFLPNLIRAWYWPLIDSNNDSLPRIYRVANKFLNISKGTQCSSSITPIENSSVQATAKSTTTPIDDPYRCPVTYWLGLLRRDVELYAQPPQPFSNLLQQLGTFNASPSDSPNTLSSASKIRQHSSATSSADSHTRV